jgi:UDP-N-acetyl-D-glucosamine dehydrogenase
MRSVELTEGLLRQMDAVLLLTDHSAYDYPFIEEHAQCIVDTRNAFGRQNINSSKIHKA